MTAIRVGLFLLLSLLATAHAAGTIPEPAKKFIKEGLALYNADKYDEARDAFIRAQVLAPEHPKLFYYIGVCDSLMGNCAGAVKNLDEYLRRAPGDKYAADATGRRDLCLMAMGRKPAATPPPAPTSTATPPAVAKPAAPSAPVTTPTAAVPTPSPPVAAKATPAAPPAPSASPPPAATVTPRTAVAAVPKPSPPAASSTPPPAAPAPPASTVAAPSSPAPPAAKPNAPASVRASASAATKRVAPVRAEPPPAEAPPAAGMQKAHILDEDELDLPSAPMPRPQVIETATPLSPPALPPAAPPRDTGRERSWKLGVGIGAAAVVLVAGAVAVGAYLATRDPLGDKDITYNATGLNPAPSGASRIGVVFGGRF